MYKDTTGVRDQFWVMGNMTYYVNASQLFTHDRRSRYNTTAPFTFGETNFVAGYGYADAWAYLSLIHI